MNRTLNAKIIAAVVGLTLLLAVPTFSPWLTFLLSIALSKGVVVLGVVLLLRAGLVSLGHGLFFGAAGYAAAFAMKYWSVTESLVLLVIGIVVSVAIAAVIGLLVARYREIFFAMLSLAFSMLLYGLLVKMYGLTGGTDGMSLPAATVLGLAPSVGGSAVGTYYLTLAFALVASFIAARFNRSPLGYVSRAIRENEIRIEYLGISVKQSIWYVYLLSAALGGGGGVLLALNVGHITPDLAYWTTSGEFVFVALLGGVGSVVTPFLGSILFEFVKNFASTHYPHVWQLIMGCTLLAIFLFAPGGLWGLYQTLTERLTSWKAHSKSGN